MTVVEANILLHDVAYMAQTEAGEKVQAFTRQRTHPDLSKGVGIRGKPRGLDRPNSRSVQQRIKARRRIFPSLQEPYEYLRAGPV